MTTAQQDQITQLTNMVKARIAPSKIHGVGVFALVDLPKGTKLYADSVPVVYTLSHANLKKLDKEVRDLLLERFPNIINGSRFVYPTERLLAFMNHDKNPNYDPASDEVMRDIKKGEEITEDYTQIPNYDKIFPFIK